MFAIRHTQQQIAWKTVVTSILTLGLIASAAQAQYPRADWVADLRPGFHQSQGLATIIDERTIQIDHFTYDGTAPAVYFYLGETDTHAAFANGIAIGPQLTRAYNDETVVVQFPPGETIDGYGAISVWCAAVSANFTSATFRCPGDLNMDGIVALADLQILLAGYGGSGNYADGDLDGDGEIHMPDLQWLLALYGSHCNPTLEMAFDGLEDLGSDYVYEGWLIVDEAPVSTGRFSIDSNGDAFPAWFVVDAYDADNAVAFVLTIEPAVGDDPAPSATHVLAGDWNGQSASLTIGHMAALGDDFTGAAGEYILATPTTSSDPNDYAQGIWWLDPGAGPGPSLTLPTLPAGWAYEGWVVSGSGPISTGRFLSVSGADSDGAGAAAGPDGAPAFPGQDFIDPPEFLIGYAAVITVEPEPDNSSAPFAFKPLVDMTIDDVGRGVPQAMGSNLASAPTGTVMLSSN